METYITIAQVIISIILIITIIMQKQGTSMSGFLGGSGESYYSRRGAEKTLFYITIILVVLFLGLGVVNIIV